MLGRLDHLLQTLIDSDFRSELPEDVSLANSYIVESSTTSSTDGETDRHELQRDKPLQLIDSIISRLYRFTSFFHTAIEDNTRTNVPRERRSVGDERKEELFADRVRSHISQQCPELYATVLQDRLVEQSIDRRSELTLSERDSERKGSQISLQFTSEPRNEEIERWETLSINFPPMPVQEANQPNPSCPYCLRDISNLLNARTEMQIPLWR
jgi:hypothetical protein